MPKVVQHTLTWLPERNAYEASGQRETKPRLLQSPDKEWFVWLVTLTSFAFQGQHGHLTLRKESRSRGEGYWYAYRGQHGQTFKRYIGRTADLTFIRLEEVASALTTEIDASLSMKHEHALTFPASNETKVESNTQEAAVSPASGLWLKQQAPLLEPKLRLPRLHSSLVERERLLALLDGGLERKLTLLSAPAGFGKTTLVSQWVVDRSTSHHLPPVAWLSLDAGDNDPVRFWRYVITACQTFRVNQDQSALALLTTPTQPPFESPPLEVVLTTFLNTLTQEAQHGLLILEDYHVITSPQIQETMIFFLDHLPTTLHVMLLTRSEPSLPLARLRARGDLCEVHATDLRFSCEETLAFVQQITVFQVSPEAIKQLGRRLDGWAAGLRLLTFALQGRVTEQAIEHTLTTFAGSHRSLQDYFVSEVLISQPEPLQIFLLCTSVLSHLTGSLCDAVTGGNDSEELLEILDRGGLFLEPLNESALPPSQKDHSSVAVWRQWYRYHTLFAEAMQHEARRRLGDTALRSVSYKASQWYEEQGFPFEAIEAALRAQDGTRIVGLIEHFIEMEHFLEISEWHTLLRWLKQIPEAVLRQHPLLCFNYALALLFISSSDQLSPEAMTQLEGLLNMAEQGWQRADNTSRTGEAYAFRSLIAWRQGEISQSVAYAKQALVLLPADELAWRGTCLNVLGRNEQLSGQLAAAHKLFLEVLTTGKVLGNRYFRRANLNMLAGVCFGQGKLYQAAEYYRQVLVEAREQEDLDDIGHAQSGLAQLSYEWNKLNEAEHEAQEVLEIGERLSHQAHQAHAILIQARVQQARRQTSLAQQQVGQLLTRLRLYSASLLYYEVQAMQLKLQLAAGDFSAVQHWAASRLEHNERLPLAHYEQEELLVSRLLIAQGRAEEALVMLERSLAIAQKADRIYTTLEIQILMALAHSALKQTHEAHRLLRVVLSLAHTEGYLRLFLDEGEVLFALLRTLLPSIHEKPLVTYLQTILRTFTSETVEQGSSESPAASSLLFEPLSPQEQRVLRLLTTGRSNPEIARELVVSVNTIRTQVQSIYRKLGVNNRVEASEA